MRLLIIGSEGFAGQALIRAGLRKGIETLGASHRAASLRYHHHHLDRIRPDFRQLVHQTQPTAIVVAASSGSVGRSQSEPAVAFRDTVHSLHELLKAVGKFAPECRVVNLSSAAVYGNANLRPTPEAAPLAPVSVYGRTKAVSEWLCRRASRDTHQRTCSLRIGSLYGQGQRKQLFWDIANRLMRHPSELCLFGDGTETRDFLNVDDFSEMVLELIERAPFQGESINIGTGTTLTIRQAAEIFAGKFGFSGPIRFLGESPPYDPRHLESDVSRLRQLTTCRPRDFTRGAEELAEWLKKELLELTSSGPTRATPDV